MMNEEREKKWDTQRCVCLLTLAVVEAVDGVIIRGRPRLVESGARVTEGRVWRMTVVHTGVPGVRVV